MPSTPAKRSIESFFSPQQSTKSKESNKSDEVTQLQSPPLKRKKQNRVNGEAGKDKLDKGKGKASAVEQEGEIETLMLSDDEEEDRAVKEEQDGAVNGGKDSEDDDVIIQEPSAPKASTSKSKETPIASIFKSKPPPTSPASSKKSSDGTGRVKVEDEKPNIKPSPTKMLSIFDTTSASSSSSTTSSSNINASTSASPSQPLDTPLFSFTPAPSYFSPHTRTPFSYLTSALLLLSSTKSRLLIQQVLTNLLRTVIELDPASLESVVYLLSNRIGPSYESGTELGVGWQVLSKAIKETSGVTPQKLKALGNKLGDPGDIAFEASKSVRLLLQPSPLMCHSIYSTLLQIAKLKGTGVLAQKTSLVKKLLLSAQGEQVRYIVRILVSNLRIGAVRLTLLTALARSLCLSRPPGMKEGGESEYWITEEEREVMAKVEMEELERMETKNAKQKKGKGEEESKPSKTGATSLKTKPRKDRSDVELKVEAKLVKAVQLVRKVWARHPNFGHLCKASESHSFSVTESYRLDSTASGCLISNEILAFSTSWKTEQSGQKRGQLEQATHLQVRSRKPENPSRINRKFQYIES
ncbi:hypothetical protein JCM3765_006944 [Sporobolomyces pararoseus]